MSQSIFEITCNVLERILYFLFFIPTVVENFYSVVGKRGYNIQSIVGRTVIGYHYFVVCLPRDLSNVMVGRIRPLSLLSC